MSDERIQQQVKLSQESDRALEGVRRVVGMTKVEMLSRVCAWFAAQPATVQRLVLGLVDDELRPAATRVLIKRLIDPTPAATEAAVDAEIEAEIEEDGRGKRRRRGA